MGSTLNTTVLPRSGFKPTALRLQGQAFNRTENKVMILHLIKFCITLVMMMWWNLSSLQTNKICVLHIGKHFSCYKPCEIEPPCICICKAAVCFHTSESICDHCVSGQVLVDDKLEKTTVKGLSRFAELHAQQSSPSLPSLLPYMVKLRTVG